MKQAAKNVTKIHPTASAAWAKYCAGAAAIILLTFLAYLPALHGQFVWDDDSWTTGIPNLLRNFAGLKAMWFHPTALQQYYPLAGTTFWTDYHLWGFWTLPYHVENILLHTTSALLFWRILRRLAVPGAWLAAAIFALHPVMVESVAWITERKNVLSMVLYLSALLSYGRFNSFWTPATERPQRRWGSYAAAFIFLTGALLTKTTAFSLPAVILLICWWKRGRIDWKSDLLPTLPFFAISIGLCVATAWLEKNNVGAKGPEWNISLPARCLIAGRVFWFYIAKLLWPANLCFNYPRWQLNTASLSQWLYPISAVAILLTLWLARNRIGRGPLTAVLFFVGTLFPVLGFMNAYFMRYSFVCDHWTYLSSLSLIALAAALIARLAARLRAPATLYSFAAVALPIFAILTWRQTRIYANLETLWGDTLEKNPGAWLASNNLGVVYSNQGKIPQAIACYQESLLFNPDYIQAHNNLGAALTQLGKNDEAIKHFETALRIEPDFSEAHYNYGVALEELGRNDEAISQYDLALRFKPDSYNPHYRMGLILMRLGKIPQAIAQFNEALTIQPDHADAHNQLALAFVQQGDLQDAIAQWSQAAQIQPDPEAEFNWGYALEKLGKNDEAIARYEESMRLNPDFFQPHFNLGRLLMSLARYPQAITQFDESVRIRPNSAPAHDDLALALCQAGQAREAITQWKLALRINPNLPDAQNGLAWLLATLSSPDGDPPRAVALAQRACDLTHHQVPGYVDTLATAYAAAGRFPDAIAAAQNALALAQSTGQSQLAAEIQSRLTLYRAGRPVIR
jgi:protein O-mannosyl-transferase